MATYQPHPGSPWVAEAVARVLEFDRHGRAIEPLPSPVGGATWSDVLDAASKHRVVEVLFPHAGALGMDGDSVAIMFGMRHQLAQAGLKLELDTNAVSVLLDAAGIEHLMIKGAAVAALMGLAPSGRGAGDVDVWVHVADLERTEQVLHANGWGRRDPLMPTPNDGWRWRLLLSIGNELPRQGGGLCDVDLHWRLTPLAGENIPDFNSAYARSVQVEGMVESVRTLCPADALRHLAQHARKEAWSTMRHVVDIVRITDVSDPEQVANMIRTDRNVALAMEVSTNLTGQPVRGWEPEVRTRKLAANAWQGCLDLRFTHRRRKSVTGGQAFSTRARFEWWQARSAPGWRARIAWLVRLVLPRGMLLRPPAG